MKGAQLAFAFGRAPTRSRSSNIPSDSRNSGAASVRRSTFASSIQRTGQSELRLQVGRIARCGLSTERDRLAVIIARADVVALGALGAAEAAVPRAKVVPPEKISWVDIDQPFRDFQRLLRRGQRRILISLRGVYRLQFLIIYFHASLPLVLPESCDSNSLLIAKASL